MYLDIVCSLAENEQLISMQLPLYLCVNDFWNVKENLDKEKKEYSGECWKYILDETLTFNVSFPCQHQP